MDNEIGSGELVEVDAFLKKVISFLFFGMMANGLGFAIDKILVLGCLFLLLVINLFQTKVHFFQLLILLFWLTVATSSSVVNLTFKPMIFFPVVGVFFVFVITQFDWIRTFHKALFLFIFLSFCFGIMAYLGGPTFTVSSLAAKGIPFLLPFKGFTTTVQTFGVICIMWIVINFELGKNKFGLDFFLVLTSLILTFNRSSYLFLFVVLAIYSKRFLWVSLILMGLALIVFFEEITNFLFNVSTLQSREELLQGFYLSYWNDNSFLGYLLGKGDNFYPPDVVSRVKWDHRPDIENGYALLLHAYGFIGLVGYLICTGLVIMYSLFIKKSIRLTVVAIFYFFVTQYFTQEFVTNTFYLFVAVILTLLDYKNENSSNKWIH